jgi:2-oxoglutarate ferredoxin oxidoreductase subunit alpha
MGRTLMKGNEALALAAIRGGCTHFFGYPITPQNEIPELFARELPKAGGLFLQAESEIAAVNMLYGAAAAGARAMTSSSSPGLALMQEGISMLAATEIPCVIVNVMRGGPGLGTIQPAQSDYYQMTRGGGNGDYRIISLAPATVQESAEMMQEAFDLARKYRTPVFLVSDGMLGQMMEPVEFLIPNSTSPEGDQSWILNGHHGRRPPRTIKSLRLDPAMLENHNLKLQEKYRRITRRELRFESYRSDDAELLFCAFGSTARIVKNSVDDLRQKGCRAGLIRPMTLWPFPAPAFRVLPENCTSLICVEMSCGQMVDDVRLAVGGRVPVHFYGRCGGVIPEPAELIEYAEELIAGGAV